MRRKIAQLAGFIDQAGLFRTLFAVTNKLHFFTPLGVSWDYSAFLACFMEQGAGKFNCRLAACCIAGMSGDEFEGIAVAPDMGTA